MKFTSLRQLKEWDLRWPAGEPGPWQIGLAGVQQALKAKPSAIGVYWIGYAPEGSHATFEPKYCGKAVRQPLLARLNQHSAHSHNAAINRHVSQNGEKKLPQAWFRFVEFSTDGQERAQ
jgi:hypothetical protein